MKNLTQDDMMDLLSKDYIGRNAQLSVFMQLISSMTGNQILAIDGSWGSGKTTFVKQLEMLCNDIELYAVPNIDQADIQIFRDMHTSIYYNAWENDYFDDALQSLLYNLVAKIDKTSGGLNENSQKKALSKIDVAGFIKKISYDGIDLTGNTTDEDLTENIRQFVHRQKVIKQTLQKLIDSKEKRILFIIDELDRCSPSFAVKILEVIKHYFDMDGITFVVAVNTEQLDHTVKKFYGSGFDGYSYLNKFFDFPFSLKKPDIKKFTANYLGRVGSGNITTKTPIEVAEFLGMEMREVESYYKSLSLIEGYMNRTGFHNEEVIEYVVQCIFVPFALALKIKDGGAYRDFIAGRNSDILTKFIKNAPEASSFAGQFCDDGVHVTPGADVADVRASELKFVIDAYDNLFTNRKQHHVREAYDNFIDATNIISEYTAIVPIGDAA